MGDKPAYIADCNVTCPKCRHVETVAMPSDHCVVRWTCPACGAELKPCDGDCCVFCSFGDVPCLPIQDERLKNDGIGMCCGVESCGDEEG